MRISQIINLINPKVRKTCDNCKKKLSQKRKNVLCVKCVKAQQNKIEEIAKKYLELRKSENSQEIACNKILKTGISKKDLYSALFWLDRNGPRYTLRIKPAKQKIEVLI